MAINLLKAGPQEAPYAWTETALQMGLSLGISCLAGVPFTARRTKLIASRIGRAPPVPP